MRSGDLHLCPNPPPWKPPPCAEWLIFPKLHAVQRRRTYGSDVARRRRPGSRSRRRTGRPRTMVRRSRRRRAGGRTVDGLIDVSCINRLLCDVPAPVRLSARLALQRLRLAFDVGDHTVFAALRKTGYRHGPELRHHGPGRRHGAARRGLGVSAARQHPDKSGQHQSRSTHARLPPKLCRATWTLCRRGIFPSSRVFHLL
jgi:hypothetical protein